MKKTVKEKTFPRGFIRAGIIIIVVLIAGFIALAIRKSFAEAFVTYMSIGFFVIVILGALAPYIPIPKELEGEIVREHP